MTTAVNTEVLRMICVEHVINAKEFYSWCVQKIDMKFFDHADFLFSCEFWEESKFFLNSYIFKEPHPFHLINLSQFSLYIVRFTNKI